MSETHFETFLRALQNCPDPQVALGEEYVLYPPDPDYGYESTPRNGLTFAAMGVDGVHYAILMIDGSVRDDSPVIQIAPMDFSSPYAVLGSSFLDYVAHACGVSVAEMESLFAKESAGDPVLIDFLKSRFDQSRL